MSLAQIRSNCEDVLAATGLRVIRPPERSASPPFTDVVLSSLEQQGHAAEVKLEVRTSAPERRDVSDQTELAWEALAQSSDFLPLTMSHELDGEWPTGVIEVLSLTLLSA